MPHLYDSGEDGVYCKMRCVLCECDRIAAATLALALRIREETERENVFQCMCERELHAEATGLMGGSGKNFSPNSGVLHL